MKFFAILATGVVASQAVAAAPYCVTVQGLPDQCIYVDGQDCQRRAGQLGGVCTANSSEITAQSGPGGFCLVIGGQATLCIYPDRAACQTDATRRHTACVQAASPPQEGVDPYAIRRPY